MEKDILEDFKGKIKALEETNDALILENFEISRRLFKIEYLLNTFKLEKLWNNNILDSHAIIVQYGAILQNFLTWWVGNISSEWIIKLTNTKKRRLKINIFAAILVC